MAQTRVFLSSTSQDLKTLRETVRDLIEELGHKPVAFEENDFLADPGKSTYDSCLAEVKKSDLLILILDRRYGSKPKGTDKSATRLEYDTARRAGIPTFVLVSKEALSEQRFYSRNGRNKTLNYDVDDPDLFDFIDEIREGGFGNWTKEFVNADDAKKWIKGQLSALLQEYIANAREGSNGASGKASPRKRRSTGGASPARTSSTLLRVFDRMSYSYKAALFQILWRHRDEKRVPISEIAREFRAYYLDRANSGLEPEDATAEMARPESLSESAVVRVLWDGPIKAMRGSILETEGTGLGAFVRLSHQVLSADHAVQQALLTKAEYALRSYFASRQKTTTAS